MKFEKKAIIFDLDGVICFTDRFHYQAWKALADRLGIYFDEKINDRLRGVSRMSSLDIILERSDKEYTQECQRHFKMSIFAEKDCHFLLGGIQVLSSLIHHITCRLEARQV